MAVTASETKLIFAEFKRDTKYQDWWRIRKSEIPRWRRRFRQALRSGNIVDIKRVVAEYYDDPPMQRLGPWNKSKVLSDGARLKTTVSLVLDEAQTLETRFSRAMTRTGGVRGVGRGTLSEWLMISDPDRYGTWNASSRAGLFRLGLMPSFHRGESWGTRYAQVLRALEEVRLRTTASNLAEVDLFLYFVGIAAEGEIAWKKVIGSPIPAVPKESYPGAGSGRPTSSTHLSESGYARTTASSVAKVERLHNKLSNRMKGWLQTDVRASEVLQERARTDLQCNHQGQSHLFELKVISDVDGSSGGHFEIRQAIGQLLDYGFFPNGVPKFRHLTIVTDSRPQESDIQWLRSLSRILPPIELLWFPEGESGPFSPRLTSNPLGRKARPANP
jgi:hypothetical protein